MWIVLTYAYNTILILFIATHLLVGALISFLVGLYMGIYFSQNYQIPRITEPKLLYQKIISFIEQKRIKKSSTIQICNPKTMLSLIRADENQDYDINHEDISRKRHVCSTTENLSGTVGEDESYISSSSSTDTKGQKSTLILTEPDFKFNNDDDQFGSRRDSSPQILEASLIIATQQHSNTNK